MFRVCAAEVPKTLGSGPPFFIGHIHTHSKSQETIWTMTWSWEGGGRQWGPKPEFCRWPSTKWGGKVGWEQTERLGWHTKGSIRYFWARQWHKKMIWHWWLSPRLIYFFHSTYYLSTCYAEYIFTMLLTFCWSRMLVSQEGKGLQCLEQCLAHSRSSINIDWVITIFQFVSRTKMFKMSNTEKGDIEK